MTVPVIFFPMGVPRDYKAMEQILADNNGDLLTNVRVTSKYSMFYLVFFFGSTQATVTADVWRVATQAELETADPSRLLSFDELGGAANVLQGQEGGAR